MDPSGRRVRAVGCDVVEIDANEVLIGLEILTRPSICSSRTPAFPARVPCDMSAEQIRRTIDVNVTGSLLSAQAALRSLVKARDGALIFTASLQSVAGRAERGVYTASKHAIGHVQVAGARVRPARWVNAIAPTAHQYPFLHEQWRGLGIDADQSMAAARNGVPLGRLPEPDDFAGRCFISRLRRPAPSRATC